MEYTDFLIKASHLKKTVRTGWTRYDIPNPESVADHSYNVALIALTIPLPTNIDRDKLVKMALLHDLAECETGDIVSRRGGTQNKEIKAQRDKNEKLILTKLFENNPEIKTLALEEFTTSPETLILKEIDKIEMAAQTLIYEKELPKGELDEFWVTCDTVIKTPELVTILQDLKSKRL